MVSWRQRNRLIYAASGSDKQSRRGTCTSARCRELADISRRSGGRTGPSLWRRSRCAAGQKALSALLVENDGGFVQRSVAAVAQEDLGARLVFAELGAEIFDGENIRAIDGDDEIPDLQAGFGGGATRSKAGDLHAITPGLGMFVGKSAQGATLLCRSLGRRGRGCGRRLR